MSPFFPAPLLGLTASVATLLIISAPCPASAAQNGGVPAVDAPCIVPSTTYTNGTAEMTLCIQGHKVWREKRNNARTTQVHATLNNTGNSMVCDLRVEVESMGDALRWWPDWLNSTRYPYFNLAPGQTVSVGAVIPQAQGFPEVSIVEMRSCDGEDPPASYYEAPAKHAVGAASAPAKAAEPAAGAAADPKPAANATAKPKPKPAPKSSAAGMASGGEADGDTGVADESPEPAAPEDDGVAASTLKKPDCATKTGAGGLKARWCIEKQPYVWVEPRHHRRIVRVRAEITNLQANVSLCGIKVELESNKSAINTWPDWWPESDEDDPLDPSNSFVIGANVYYKKGAPKIHLLGFRACIDTGAVPEEPEPPAAGPAPAAPITNPTAPAMGGQQQQQQGWNAGSAGSGGTNNGQQQPQPAAPAQNDWNNNNHGQQQDGGNNNWGQSGGQQQGNNWGQQQQPQTNWGGNNNNGGGNTWWQN